MGSKGGVAISHMGVASGIRTLLQRQHGEQAKAAQVPVLFIMYVNSTVTKFFQERFHFQQLTDSSREGAVSDTVNLDYTDLWISFPGGAMGLASTSKPESVLLEDIQNKSGAFFPYPSNHDHVRHSCFIPPESRTHPTDI